METEQSEYDSEFYTRKREHIIRDWEAAWTTLGLVDKWVHALRGWSIALVLAYLGFMNASNHIGTWTSFWAVLLPPALAIVVFFLLELQMKSLSFYYREYIRAIDNIFSTQTVKDFRIAVSQHKFLFQREKEPRDQASRYLRAIKKSYWTWFWYSFLLVATTLIVVKCSILDP